jgi:transmembrane sensor
MPNPEHASEIEDAATVWAAKAERGLTESEKTDFDAWIEDDSRRLGAYVRAQAAWIHAERAAALGKMPESEPMVIVDDRPAETPRHSLLSRRIVMGGGGALAASAAAAYVVGVERYHTLESGVGEIRHIALKNGAALVLDTDTRVDVVSSSNDRKLNLVRGQLFLDVARTLGAPLTVTAGNLTVETIAGSFGLQNLIKAPLMAVVTDGELLVSQSQGAFRNRRSIGVNRGHVLRLAPNSRLAAAEVHPAGAAEQAQLLAWRDGMISFGGEMLADAVRAFDRYGATRIVVADPALARQKITGLFKANDPRGFATAIAASLGGAVSGQGELIRITANKLA